MAREAKPRPGAEFYRELCACVGKESADRLIGWFGGSQRYFPQMWLLAVDARDQDICEEWLDGANPVHLGKEWNITSTRIRQILTKHLGHQKRRDQLKRKRLLAQMRQKRRG